MGGAVEAFAFHQRWMTERWTDYGFAMRSFVGTGATYTAAEVRAAMAAMFSKPLRAP